MVLAGCARSAPDDDRCTCAPNNATQLAGPRGAVNGDTILALLRRHARMVAEQRPGRDVKLLDDELRTTVAHFCTPCGEWVGDRATMEGLFPLARLDDATTATCLGLVLRDGTTTWGDARPRACRSR